jgi:hypothetical protein
VPDRHAIPAPQSATAVADVHGFPLLAPVWQMSLLKAPFDDVVWPGQKSPVALERLATPVVSGFRLIGMSPMNWTQLLPAHWELDVQIWLLLGPR